jgi:hypothetical protein
VSTTDTTWPPPPPNEEPRAAGWRPALKVGLTVWTLSRLGFLLFAAAITHLWPPVTGGHQRGLMWIFGVYARFDSGHFARIANYGYLSRGRGDVNVAFFPGYPLSVRVVSDVLGLGHVTPLDRLAALAVIAWAGTGAAAVLLWRYVAVNVTPDAATISVVMLLAGPYSLFLMASYSEGPFLAFALAAWLCAQRGRWSWAGILCAAAALIRVNGLFLLAGLAVIYVQSNRRRHEPLLRPALASLLLPLASVASYVIWLRLSTGYWDAWFRAEKRGWQRQTEWPWQTLVHSIHNFQNTTANAPAHFQATMELLFAAIYLVSLLALARHRMWSEFTYVGLTAAALLTSSQYQSVPRSMIVCFPIFLLLARWCADPRHRWILATAALASATLLVVDTTLYVRGYHAG